jgi:hypothetical protein
VTLAVKGRSAPQRPDRDVGVRGRVREVRRFACILRSVRCRELDFRVDLRDGRTSAGSNAYDAFAATVEDAFLGKPARRSVALTPAFDVSTGTSRRRRGGLLGFLGPDLSVE